jgi:hypothetical protein
MWERRIWAGISYCVRGNHLDGVSLVEAGHVVLAKNNFFWLTSTAKLNQHQFRNVLAVKPG